MCIGLPGFPAVLGDLLLCGGLGWREKSPDSHHVETGLMHIVDVGKKNGARLGKQGNVFKCLTDFSVVKY